MEGKRKLCECQTRLDFCVRVAILLQFERFYVFYSSKFVRFFQIPPNFFLNKNHHKQAF